MNAQTSTAALCAIQVAALARGCMRLLEDEATYYAPLFDAIVRQPQASPLSGLFIPLIDNLSSYRDFAGKSLTFLAEAFCDMSPFVCFSGTQWFSQSDK